MSVPLAPSREWFRPHVTARSERERLDKQRLQSFPAARSWSHFVRFSSVILSRTSAAFSSSSGRPDISSIFRFLSWSVVRYGRLPLQTAIIRTSAAAACSSGVLTRTGSFGATPRAAAEGTVAGACTVATRFVDLAASSPPSSAPIADTPESVPEWGAPLELEAQATLASSLEGTLATGGEGIEDPVLDEATLASLGGLLRPSTPPTIPIATSVPTTATPSLPRLPALGDGGLGGGLGRVSGRYVGIAAPSWVSGPSDLRLGGVGAGVAARTAGAWGEKSARWSSDVPTTPVTPIAPIGFPGSGSRSVFAPVVSAANAAAASPALDQRFLASISRHRRNHPSKPPGKSLARSPARSLAGAREVSAIVIAAPISCAVVASQYCPGFPPTSISRT